MRIKDRNGCDDVAVAGGSGSNNFGISCIRHSAMLMRMGMCMCVCMCVCVYNVYNRYGQEVGWVGAWLKGSVSQ